MDNRRTIGRIDFADFPKLGLYEIPVKVDTGAYTCAIHCQNIRVEEIGEQLILKFNILDPEFEQFHDQEFHFRKFSKRKIKNSFGEDEERYIIETIIILFGQEFKIEISLADRENMQFPVLLGRRLLENFIIDVTQKNLSLKSQKYSTQE